MQFSFRVPLISWEVEKKNTKPSAKHLKAGDSYYIFRGLGLWIQISGVASRT
jgi:hypothetical protein